MNRDIEKKEAIEKLVDGWVRLIDIDQLTKSMEEFGRGASEIVKDIKVFLYQKAINYFEDVKEMDLSYIDTVKGSFINSFNNNETVTNSYGFDKPINADNFYVGIQTSTINDETFEVLKEHIKYEVRTRINDSTSIKCRYIVFGVSIDGYKDGYNIKACIYKEKLK